jgi:hypothetical protein
VSQSSVLEGQPVGSDTYVFDYLINDLHQPIARRVYEVKFLPTVLF